MRKLATNLFDEVNGFNDLLEDTEHLHDEEELLSEICDDYGLDVDGGPHDSVDELYGLDASKFASRFNGLYKKAIDEEMELLGDEGLEEIWRTTEKSTVAERADKLTNMLVGDSEDYEKAYSVHTVVLGLLNGEYNLITAKEELENFNCFDEAKKLEELSKIQDYRPELMEIFASFPDKRGMIKTASVNADDLDPNQLTTELLERLGADHHFKTKYNDLLNAFEFRQAIQETLSTLLARETDLSDLSSFVEKFETELVSDADDFEDDCVSMIGTELFDVLDSKSVDSGFGSDYDHDLDSDELSSVAYTANLLNKIANGSYANADKGLDLIRGSMRNRKSIDSIAKKIKGRLIKAAQEGDFDFDPEFESEFEDDDYSVDWADELDGELDLDMLFGDKLSDDYNDERREDAAFESLLDEVSDDDSFDVYASRKSVGRRVRRG